METNTVSAAILILSELRKIHENRIASGSACSGTPAMLWERAIHRGARAAAFRRLSKIGLIEVAEVTTCKLWRLTEKGLSVRPGEEFSAVA